MGKMKNSAQADSRVKAAQVRRVSDFERLKLYNQAFSHNAGKGDNCDHALQSFISNRIDEILNELFGE